MKLKDLVVVTSNKGKLFEINNILGTHHKLSKIEVPEIQSLDLNEVIKAKAKGAYEIIKKPVMVEDVGVQIKSLGGLPGPFIKFFLKTIGTQGIINLIGTEKNATVTEAVAIYDGKTMHIFKGSVSGIIADKDRGEHGFGFDRIFIPTGYKKTYSEMSDELKNRISHRAKALAKVKKFLD